MVVRNEYTPSELALFESIGPMADETGTFYAVVKFKTDLGETIIKQLDIGSNPPLSVGHRMLLFYNPNNPLEFVTYPWTKLKFFPKLLVAIGLIGLLVSIMDLFGVISIIPN